MALLSLKKLPALFAIGGGVLYGRPFLTMIWAFITDGIPTVWRNHVKTNAYYQGFRNGTWAAIVLPFIGLVLGLLLARIHIGLAQAIIYLSFVVSYVILGVLLFLGDTFGDIAINLLPEDEQTEEDLQDLRVGIKKHLQTILAFELFFCLSFVVLGVYASLGAVAVILLALGAYYQVSDAYDRPVTWAPGFMMNTSITAIFVLVTLVVLSLIPVTRPYMLRVGINPVSFLHRGVISAGKYGDAKAASLKKERELCDAEIEAIKASIDGIDVNKPITAKDPKTPRSIKKELDGQLEEKQKSCTF